MRFKYIDNTNNKTRIDSKGLKKKVLLFILTNRTTTAIIRISKKKK
jgi:hypothetical protein